MPGPRRHLAVSGACLAVALSAAAWLALGRSRPWDSSFDTRVAAPAFRGEGPVVLFDEGHRSVHEADGAYRPLAELLRNDGCRVRVHRGPLSADLFRGVSLLVVAGARGPNDANDAPAFTEAETGVVERWVREGGALLLVTDHWPFGTAAESLAARFGVGMGKGLVEDGARSDPARGASHLVFSVENGLLADHAIARGRGDSGRVRRVLTFTGQSVSGPPGSTMLLRLSDSAVEWQPTAPRVTRNGGDVRVDMEYGASISAKGRAQAVALEAGKGRVVVLGDAAMLRAQREKGGVRVGMNAPGYDDRDFALNVVRWLLRAL